MYTLYAQELNKTQPLVLLCGANLVDSFKQLAFYEKNTINPNPNVMFWVEDSYNPDTVLVPPCTN